MAQPCWHNANVFYGPASMGPPTRIENAYELLNRPGEWYLDQRHGWIYYKPARSERLGREDFEAAATQVLVDARGTLAHPISHLRFDGLTFAYATWMGVSGPQGYADDQGNRYKTGTYISIEPANWQALRECCYLFEVVTVGFQVPQSAMDQFRSGRWLRG